MKKFAAFVLSAMSIFIFAACSNEAADDDWTFTSTSGYLYSEADIGSEGNDTSSSLANSDGVEPFTPTSNSTWGDLHRHFDPEGFNALPKDIQEQLDNSLLKDDGAEDNPVTETTIGDWTIVSAEGYLYAED